MGANDFIIIFVKLLKNVYFLIIKIIMISFNNINNFIII